MVRRRCQSLIVVAVPRPAHAGTATYRGRAHLFILPPTYHRYSSLSGELRRELVELLGSQVSLAPVSLPLKALAVGVGLARYGRNNIAYVRGLGSYVQLLAFSASTPVQASCAPQDQVQALLETCRDCRACQSACPTGAIGGDRFLLRAERCLTWFSEYEGPLPEVFGSVSRPCLVGCLACQEACPHNHGLLRIEHLDVRFTEAETAWLLGEADATALPPELCAKALGLDGFSVTSDGASALLRRNLAAVVKTA